MQNDLNLSQEKQADLLEFTSKLTDKNSQLQTEIQCQNDKLEQLELEINELKTNDLTESFKSKLNSISEKLESEINKSKYLEDDLIRKEKEIEHLNEKLNEQEHELNTMRKKHANNVKDLTKQLQILHKKVQSYEANEKQMNESSPVTPTSTVDDDSKSINSETISTAHCSELICGYNEDFYVVDVDKQKLVEKIVNLQKTLAKQNEKNDFLQDHINLLTVELKRKTKIIQYYAMNQENGMFTNETNSNLKKQIALKPNQINAKLQELLEETLIKNITLKENVETLGEEISRLSMNSRPSLL